MTSVKEGEEQPPATAMRFSFCVENSLSKDTGFHWRNRGLRVIVLIGYQHMPDVVRMVQQIHRWVRLS
jgi:hypothetical protein